MMQALNLEPLKAMQAASFDIAFGLTTKTLDACQQLTALGVQTFRESLSESQKHVLRASAVKDAPELFALQLSLVEPTTERMRNYVQRVCEIAAGTRAEYQKVAQAQFDSNLRNMQQALEKASQGAPSGTDGTWNAWQSTLASTAAFYDSMQQATQHAIELAEHQVIDAAATASSAARKANAESARSEAKR
ncbi:phasin family protein [Cupriavidus sp. USMAHM13]|uniref:phasin family protein n=1 Tax=Cupriavidus sp. USMAHM13 TaxID=1389192 RepID=UPI0018D2D8EA|nr:phasin family protein [Cupriavidus sp. USMAHM13]